MKEQIPALKNFVQTQAVSLNQSNATPKSYLSAVAFFCLLPSLVLIALKNFENSHAYFLPIVISLCAIYFSIIVYALYGFIYDSSSQRNSSQNTTSNQETAPLNQVTNCVGSKFVNYTDVLEKEIVWEKGILYEFHKEKCFVGNPRSNTRFFTLHHN